jgi:hypothetical protein
MKLCITVVAVVALVSLVAVDGSEVRRRRELKGGSSSSSSSKSLKDKKDKGSVKHKKEKTTKPSKPSGGGGGGSDCKDTDAKPAAVAAPTGCLTKEGVNAIIKAFEGAVVAISDVRMDHVFGAAKLGCVYRGHLAVHGTNTIHIYDSITHAQHLHTTTGLLVPRCLRQRDGVWQGRGGWTTQQGRL